ncbi:uncharacterized protein V3H82_008444 [Fundulus diaphanus]
MNGAVVLFVEKVEQAHLLVETGISVHGSFLQVLPLVQPDTKVILSNVPPFVSDEFLVKELSRHGKLVSPIRKILSGCKSPLLKHVVSHRRQLYMILNKRDEELNLCFKVKIDDFDYVLFATSSNMKCFGCGGEGHLIRMCPNRAGSAPSDTVEQQPAAAGEQVGVSGEAGAPAAVEDSGAAGNSSVTAEEPVASGPVAGDQEESLVEDKTVEEPSNLQKSDCVVNEGSTVVCGGGETCVTGEEGEDQGEMEQDGMRGDQGEKGGGEVIVEEPVVVFVEEKGEGEQVMELEAPKRRSKRKNVVAAVQASRQVSKLTTERKVISDSSDSDGELSDSSVVSLSQSSCGETRYPVESFLTFLQQTKGLRGVKVESYFPDLRTFYFSARDHIRNKENITEMDAPSSFFFSLERKHGQRKQIHSLLSDTGQQLSEPGQIRRRAVEFYRSLFHSEYKENEELLKEFCDELPQVSEETNAELGRPLGLQELHTALLSMQGQRSPGVDGLTVEFYKAYWDLLAQDLLDVYNESLLAGSLPLSCRRAVITLLPKKGNLQDIKNWRPVSLLCTDYKILSKALATRLGRAMEQVIHRDQTYYQEKAFDRVEHDFLWETMRRFGFGEGLIAKIQVLYSDIESVLKINGSLKYA